MKHIKTVILLLLQLFSKCILAQIPLNDATWTKTYTDLFNTTTLNSQWGSGYGYGQSPNQIEFLSPSNLILNGPSNPGLSIKCESAIPPYYDSGSGGTFDYISGAIHSNFSAKYGYFEISAQMPIGQGFWPAFWIFNSGPLPAVSPTCWYNEIDIVENAPSVNNNGTEMGWNYHWLDATCTRDFPNPFPSPITGLPNTLNTHKYAVLWEPGKMTWFFDDQPVNVINDASHTPDHALFIVINFALNGSITGTLPAYFKINYFNLWQLNFSDTCGTSESICNFNSSTYLYEVKKSIDIGGFGCNSSINTSSNVNFWATDYILLDEGTTITDNGSGAFSAIITSCPN